MSDYVNGLIKGVGMGLCIAEKNRKNPKRIESLLVVLIRALVTVSANETLKDVTFEVEWGRKHGAPYPKR